MSLAQEVDWILREPRVSSERSSSPRSSLGPGFVIGVGNGLILGYLMYASGLMPRRLAVLGLVGGSLICIFGVLVMFGAADQGGTLQGIATIPELIWELSLGLYPLIRWFRPSPILSDTWSEPRLHGGPAVTVCPAAVKTRKDSARARQISTG